MLALVIAMVGMVGTSVRVAGLPWLMQTGGAGSGPASGDGFLLMGETDMFITQMADSASFIKLMGT